MKGKECFHYLNDCRLPKDDCFVGLELTSKYNFRAGVKKQ
jgi:hypothetical protein